MHGTRTKEDGDGIMSLVKETADGLGRLIADHIKLARLELVSDVKSYGRHSVLLGLMVVLVILGYALVCVGLSLALALWLGGVSAFFLVGGVHVVAGGIGVVATIRRLKQTRLMDETAHEVIRSVSTLTGQRTNGSGSEARS